jgi:hypothetical protein
MKSNVLAELFQGTARVCGVGLGRYVLRFWVTGDLFLSGNQESP